jgi:hypothetical protein
MSRYAEVYSAHYRIDAKFSGLRYLMFNFPTMAAIFGTSLNMFILVAIMILSWYRFFAPNIHQYDGENDEFQDDPFDSENGAKSGEISKEDGEGEKSDSNTDEEFNLLGENVENMKEKEEQDFGLPDFSSSKDLW